MDRCRRCRTPVRTDWDRFEVWVAVSQKWGLVRGLCHRCYERETGKCFTCQGTGRIENYPTQGMSSECFICSGSGRAT